LDHTLPDLGLDVDLHQDRPCGPAADHIFGRSIPVGCRDPRAGRYPLESASTKEFLGMEIDSLYRNLAIRGKLQCCLLERTVHFVGPGGRSTSDYNCVRLAAGLDLSAFGTDH
jgi:hypothetical protein